MATIILPKMPTFLGNFGKWGKIFRFSTEIIYWATFIEIWRIFTGHTALLGHEQIEGQKNLESGILCRRETDRI